MGRQHGLAQTDRTGRDLDALVLTNELERLFQGDLEWRDESHQLLGGLASHVGHLAFLRRVDVEVLRPGVLADDHPFIDFCARTDEERAALLEIQQCVGGGQAAPVCDQRARRTGADLAQPGFVAFEHVMELPGASGLGEELGPEPDQAPGRNDVFHPDPSGPVIHHLRQSPLS